MTLSTSFNDSSAKKTEYKVARDRRGREIKSEADFLSKRLRQADGSYATYRNGKMIAKEDAPQDSKFHVQTPVSTIVAQPPETENRVKKPLDVNAPSMKL